MSLSVRRWLERDASHSDRPPDRSIFLLPRKHTEAPEDRTVAIAVPQLGHFLEYRTNVVLR